MSKTARTKARGRERAISDKERLDWLTRQTVPYPFETKVEDGQKVGWRAWIERDIEWAVRKSPRSAIDAAIRASRKKPK